MKSKEFGAYVHSEHASSISNLQFGATNKGWIGDKSVPMTSADGNSSAKSLPSPLAPHDCCYPRESQPWRTEPIFLFPFQRLVPASITSITLRRRAGVFRRYGKLDIISTYLRAWRNRRKEELIIKEYGKHMVATLEFSYSFWCATKPEAYLISSWLFCDSSFGPLWAMY